MSDRAAALKALHSKRRGVRVNDPGMTPHQLTGLLSDVAGLLAWRHEPGVVSMRALAAAVGVSDRTVRRWLDGIDIPDARSVRRIERWVMRKGK
jgi:hypothetical protein